MLKFIVLALDQLNLKVTILPFEKEILKPGALEPRKVFPLLNKTLILGTLSIA